MRSTSSQQATQRAPLPLMCPSQKLPDPSVHDTFKSPQKFATNSCVRSDQHVAAFCSWMLHRSKISRLDKIGSLEAPAAPVFPALCRGPISPPRLSCPPWAFPCLCRGLHDLSLQTLCQSLLCHPWPAKVDEALDLKSGTPWWISEHPRRHCYPYLH